MYDYTINSKKQTSWLLTQCKLYGSLVFTLGFWTCDYILSECQILCLLFSFVCLSYKNVVQLVLSRMCSVLPYKDCMVHATSDCCCILAFCWPMGNRRCLRKTFLWSYNRICYGLLSQVIPTQSGMGFTAAAGNVSLIWCDKLKALFSPKLEKMFAIWSIVLSYYLLGRTG